MPPGTKILVWTGKRLGRQIKKCSPLQGLLRYWMKLNLISTVKAEGPT